MNLREGWFGWMVLFLIAGCFVLAVIGIALNTEKSKTENVSTLPLSGISVNRYGVAGGGEQHVVTFTGDTGRLYEIAITELE